MPPTILENQTDDDRVVAISPTFKIFSGTLKAFEKDASDGTGSRKFLSCTASSTIEDLHGDRMTAECVQGMAPQAKNKGMTIFLNHSYKVPEDVFGKTTDAKIVSRSVDKDGSAVYDLDLEIMLNESNPRAIDTYASIKDQGMKMGVSIGAMIEDWEFLDEEAGWWGGLEIKSVNLLEASIVGIPANQRSWVVNGMNALGAPRNIIAKALGKGDPEDQPPVAKKSDKPVTDDSETTTDVEDSTAPSGETPAEGETTSGEADTPDPTDTDKGLAPVGETTAETLRAAGISDAQLDLVMSLLEGATEEVVSLREILVAKEAELAQAQADVLESAEIVEMIAKTPLGRKAGFAGPVSSFRTKFGGIYDESLIRLLEGDDTNE